MDINALYQEKTLNYARVARAAGRLVDGNGHDIFTAAVKNPSCGDEVTIDVTISGDAIAQLGVSVAGCAICEAATGLALTILPGMNIHETQSLPQKIALWLGNEDAPLPFPLAEDIAPLRAFHQRHHCMILPFKAAANATASKE